MKRGQTSTGNPPIAHGSSPLPSGFTLVEILTALAVLMIALSGIIGLLYGSFRHGRSAADRSAAAILIPEAIRHIALNRYKLDGTYEVTPADPEIFPKPSAYSAGGNHYRFKYRLVRHEDWLAHPVDSPYRQLYALTVVCYRDSERDASKLLPLSDPVTVYLRERK